MNAAAKSSRRPGRPWFTTIDRYVLGLFLKNYVLSLVVLTGLWIVLDLLFNFDSFVKPTGTEAEAADGGPFKVVLDIADFYFYQSFRFFSYIAGIVPVVAASFTLLRMSRFNELTALLVAGVKLQRVAAPIIVASIFINVGLQWVNQEILVPSFIEKITRRHSEVAGDASASARKLDAIHDGQHSLLFASLYTPPSDRSPATLDEPIVYIDDTAGRQLIRARRATWDAATRQWQLEGGSRFALPHPGQTATSPPTSLDVWQTTLSPDVIALIVNRGDFVDLLSLRRIDQLLELPGAVGKIDLLRVREARIAAYAVNIILVILAIPCVLTREPRLLRQSSVLVFLLVGGCMATVFITQGLAGQPRSDPALAVRWPGLMAWTPVMIFAPLAFWMFSRIKT